MTRSQGNTFKVLGDFCCGMWPGNCPENDLNDSEVLNLGRCMEIHCRAPRAGIEPHAEDHRRVYLTGCAPHIPPPTPPFRFPYTKTSARLQLEFEIFSGRILNVECNWLPPKVTFQLFRGKGIVKHCIQYTEDFALDTRRLYPLTQIPPQDARRCLFTQRTPPRTPADVFPEYMKTPIHMY